MYDHIMDSFAIPRVTKGLSVEIAICDYMYLNTQKLCFLCSAASELSNYNRLSDVKRCFIAYRYRFHVDNITTHHSLVLT